MSVSETDKFARLIERKLEFLPDGIEVHNRWRQILVAHEVKGVQVHDARLAASMYVHAISTIVTTSVAGGCNIVPPPPHAALQALVYSQ